MRKTLVLAALLSGTMFTATAQAQTQPATSEAPVQEQAGEEIVPPAAPANAEETATQVEFLQAQVGALQAQLDSLKKQVTTSTPSWKAAPQFASGNGFTFKPKGFVQFDAGYIEREIGAQSYNGLGFGNRARRIVFGAEGSMPGGFGYKVELNLAQSAVDYEDVVLTYQRAGSPIQVTVGNFYPLSSLETMTSSRLGSFMERATFTEAFGYNRRLGAAIALTDKADSYTLTAGIFGQEINNSNDGTTRTGWQGSVRGTYSPMLGSTRLHIGGSYQHRVFQRDAQGFQYRARPFTQITGQRFIDTGNLAANGDDVVGIELAAIHGPLHFAAEGQKLWVDSHAPGHVFDRNNGTAGRFLLDSPSFTSVYGEVGFYLTGESRGYKGGKWDRTKVLKPFDQGGMGAIQINARVDYTDLNDRVAAGANLTTANNFYVNGGKQVGYQASVIWNPMDYIRFMAQFSHTVVDGGSQAATVNPLPATTPINARSYKFNSLAMRAQVEF
ncbi:porin [Sphingomonas sp. KC8]|uniref:porin n=1 Tax=Sphingomonas sp. KC8 TaxID=1030157 RepID=UPI000A31CB44|nr:porin [Sphingomonas sp. KC8]ARS25726.1 hypothetical protein KC8_00235 [Sphingomonas sp. KC8]